MKSPAGDAAWSAAAATLATALAFAAEIAVWKEDIGWTFILMMFVGPIEFLFALGIYVLLARWADRTPAMRVPILVVGGATLPFLGLVLLEVGGGQAEWKLTGLLLWLRQLFSFFWPLILGGAIGGGVMAWRRRPA